MRRLRWVGRHPLLLRAAVLPVLAVLAGMLWWRWGLAGVAVAGGIALVGGLIVWAVAMPGRLAPPVPTKTLAEITDARARLEVTDARTRLHHDLRNGALQLLTVLAVLVGAGVGFQQLAEDRDQGRQDRQLTRQGQASERFTRAIDQLGSSRVETRIGGIYGLDQIAAQSPENTGPVGEVLLAWLNGRPQPDSAPRAPLRPGSQLREHAPDVQAALSVLTGRRYSTIVAHRLDLHGLGLTDADLRGADLRGANLRGANLWGADLRDADLRDADLYVANLYGANLNGANLNGAHLTGASLRYDADLIGADLSGTELSGANLNHANLRDADLREASLRDANLWGANLRNADLRNASLYGTDLAGAILDGADLVGASVDGRTRWSPGFDWRRAGAEVAP